MLSLASVMIAVESSVVEVLGTEVGRPREFRVAGSALASATVIMLAVLTLRDRPPLAAVPRLLTRVWRDPPGAWVSFVLGVVVSVPVLALFSPLLGGDSDSARLLASVRYVQREGLGYLVDTQEPYLPPLLLTPVLAVGGLAGAKLVAILLVQVLAGTTSFVVHVLSRSMWGAAAAAVSLLCVSGVLGRAVRLPMYALMLALGYLGAWLAYRAMRAQVRPWRAAVPAGICLALAQEAHPVGQLFLAVPAILVILAPDLRAGLRTMTRLYVVVALAMIPRIVINLWEGGLSFVTIPRTDYWITKGYVTELQTNFLTYDGINEGLGEFLVNFPARFDNALGSQGWLIILLACASVLVCCRGRRRAFVLACFGFLLLALTVKRVPSFSRYYAPFWPGLAMLVGLLVAALQRRRRLPARVAAVAVTAGLVVAAVATLRQAAEASDRSQALIESGPAQRFAAAMDDGRGVIGARAHQFFLSVTPDVPTWGDQFLTEEEYVTYLTWPSTDAVLEVLEAHDIGWVYISWARHLETEYNNTWLLPHYGRPSRHIAQIANNPSFCRWLAEGGNVLFRVGPCPAPEPGGGG